jgi:hypothetical protein
MSTFKYTEDGSVLDQDGYLIADYAYWRDARACCEAANKQLSQGEEYESVVRRLRSWALEIDLEQEADSAAAIHFAD